MVPLFGVLPVADGFLRHGRDLVASITLIVRRRILLDWKETRPPCHAQSDVFGFIKLEKIKYIVRWLKAQFQKTWRPFLDRVDLEEEPLPPLCQFNSISAPLREK